MRIEMRLRCYLVIHHLVIGNLQAAIGNRKLAKGLYFNIDIILWHILDQMPSMLNTMCLRKEFHLLPKSFKRLR